MKNIPIIGKFLSIMALFGVFALGVTGYTALQISKIDTSYSQLLTREAAAMTAISRASRSMQNARAAISDILMARTDALNASAQSEFETAVKTFTDFMTTAMTALPERTDLGPLKQDGLRILNTTCANSIKLGLASTTPEQIAASEEVFLKECQPSFVDITPRFTTVVRDIDSAQNAQSGKLSDVSMATILDTEAGIVVGLAVIMILGFFLIRAWLVTPIRGLASTMEVLAGGNLSANVDGTDRRDEVGTMAKAVQVFKDNGLKAKALEAEAASARSMTEAERARVAEVDAKRAAEMAEATSGLAEGLKQLAGGNLGFELSRPFASDFEGLRSDFNMAVSQLRDTLSAVADATRSIDSGSRELSSSANDLSKRTEQQAASLEETAAALDEITANVSNASKRTEEARTMAMDANKSAEKSESVVADAVNAMQRIEASSSQISNIIGVIDEIAFQTNLLALNAGVEAARAGEAGKGFAVVAQEVRELAQRSAQAAKEIKDLIRTSADEVENGVRLVSATGDALKMIGGYVVSINGQLDAIATSAREQSVGLSEVNTAVNQMDQTTQQNAAMVEQATAASASLAGEADKLRQLVGRFQIGGGSASGYGHGGYARSSAPVAASSRHAAAPSPARKLVSKLARAVGVGGGSSAAATESWEEF
ncbi:methyl-accepting chemotaxis protein [Rhizobium oryzicola]|uniref:HAMP domain-containing methyl-accepting chemotaxis protein n=1 Tax=Rhizobium oryzicola TaxID=1232668 RepID=A0ABT8T281_9HYPH|nr:HAMP domain-containing methyl-accepting chemotaxis protein [Rhizobium oryzicola]MDO1584645.1 HAMP domain-containing methyl-accepting chemotaxis protein [Rhizobium oryzicola]